MLALVAFPFVLILAWFFERAPGGDLRRTPDASRGEIEGIVTEPALRRWAAGVVALAGVGLLLWSVWPEGRAGVAEGAAQQALEERTVWLPFITVQPDLAPLRADPRYRLLRSRLGLE